MKYTEKQITNNVFAGLRLYEPDCYHDFRGYYWTIAKGSEFDSFKHDKLSVSKQNVLRGVHGDSVASKLITCVYGEIYYVAVDNREHLTSYGDWRWIMLSHTNRKAVMVPPGVGSGYFIVSKEASVLYKWSYPNEYPDTDDQFTIPWDDPVVNISWPTTHPIIQDRDKHKII